MVLLIKAGKDAGLKVEWDTYYGGSPGAVTAIGEAGVDTLKQVIGWHRNATPELDATVAAFSKRYHGQGERVHVLAREDDVGDVRGRGEEGQVERSGKVARALEGLKMKTSLGEVEMRADNHQLLQPLFVSTLSDATSSTTAKTRASAGRPTPRSKARRPHCRRRARWSGRSDRSTRPLRGRDARRGRPSAVAIGSRACSSSSTDLAAERHRLRAAAVHADARASR